MRKELRRILVQRIEFIETEQKRLKDELLTGETDEGEPDAKAADFDPQAIRSKIASLDAQTNRANSFPDSNEDICPMCYVVEAVFSTFKPVRSTRDADMFECETCHMEILVIP